MAVARLVVLIVTLVAIAVAPMLWGHSNALAAAESAYASTVTGLPSDGSSVRQANENDDDEDSDDDGEDNDNTDDDGEDNDNADVADDPGTGAEQGVAGGSPVGVAGAGVSPAVRCYDAGTAGAINLQLAGGGVMLDVVPASPFLQASEVSLHKVDPTTVPAPPGALLEDFVFDVQALNGCGGPEVGQLPSAVNLGISYAVPANKSSLQIAYWDGANWVDVQTAPDPSPDNPYISATIQNAGTYAVYQR